ncbi:MAG: FHA domain-containing protein [Chloroflexi bacterium]|nr:FHA domain-containing protein [Chloroflexota bacterium]MCC6892066.1 FHA domain-containing protein [Anaerolineae bacterium]
MTVAPLDLWIIELSNPLWKAPLRLRVENKMNVGRVVAGDTDKRPDVDLTPYSAELMGVSRLHFAIEPDADRLLIRDLGSGNGTQLNGNRIKADEAYRLSTGDQIMAGLLRLDVTFVLSPTYGGTVHRQPSLQLTDQTQLGKGQLVLIVEQDEEFASAIALILEQAGYTTKIAHEVVGAIRAFNQNRPSAIIVNPILPDMSGLEFCRYIRRDVKMNTTPMVVIGTAAKSPESAEAMKAGVEVFLERPISAQELQHVMSSLISQHETGKSNLYTKHLVGTAPLKAVQPETRRNTCVLFVAGHSDTPIVLAVLPNQPVSFGRAVTTGGLKSHIDLTRYDAANWGVSRIHMILHHKDGQFWVEDQGSVNGSYLNGDPLKPKVLTPLKNADEVRLGQLRMYIYFLDDSEEMPSAKKPSKKKTQSVKNTEPE